MAAIVSLALMETQIVAQSCPAETIAINGRF